jgi:hypothetical protein
MQRALLVRAALAACLLTMATASLVAAAGQPPERVRATAQRPALSAPPIYAQVRYVVDGIYQQYDVTGGYISTGIGCRGPCTTSISTSYGWSNSWSATITFKKEPIDVAAGFNTSLSGSLTYSQSFPVPSGRSGVIWYADYYHVKKMNIHTETCYPLSPCTNKYGTATARAWFKRIYYVVLS